MTSATATDLAEAFAELREAFGVAIDYAGTSIVAIIAEADLGRELVAGGFAQTGDLSCKVSTDDMPTGAAVGTTFAAAASTDRLTTLTNHGLSIGDRVTVEQDTGYLPAPLAEGNNYYVESVPGPAILTLSATRGGPLLDILDDGGTASIIKLMIPKIGDLAVYNGRDFRVSSVARQPGNRIVECTLRPAKR